MLDYEKYIEGIRIISTAFNLEVSKERIAFFYEHLKKMNEKQFFGAIENLIRSEPTLPKDVNLVAAIRTNFLQNGIY